MGRDERRELEEGLFLSSAARLRGFSGPIESCSCFRFLDMAVEVVLLDAVARRGVLRDSASLGRGQ